MKRPVEPQPGQALHQQGLYVFGRRFAKRIAADGTFGKNVLRTYLGSPVLLDGVRYEVTVTEAGTYG